MPRVLVYEFLTAHGIGRDPASPEHSLYREGRAMRDAVAEDVGRIPGYSVEKADQPSSLAGAGRFDRAVVIAPELGGQLDQDVRLAIEAGGVPVGASPAAIRLTSDKLSLADYWVRHAVQTPHTLPAAQWPRERLPAVFKPRDGAGSSDTFLVESPEDFDTYAARATEGGGSLAVAQDFVAGRPASVAFLIGPERIIPLLPAFQRISTDGRFRYLGGELPIPPTLAERAIHLGRRAVECVPGLLGYVGVDLVLGDTGDGSKDYAIEINPRLTTSYVGLRALADFSIAEAMLRLAAGEPPPEIRWKPGRVRFGPDGSVGYDPPAGGGDS